MIVNSFVLFCWVPNVFVSQEPTDRETKMVRKWTQKTFPFFLGGGGFNLTYDDTNLSLLYHWPFYWGEKIAAVVERN